MTHGKDLVRDRLRIIKLLNEQTRPVRYSNYFNAATQDRDSRELNALVYQRGCNKTAIFFELHNCTLSSMRSARAVHEFNQ